MASSPSGSHASSGEHSASGHPAPAAAPPPAAPPAEESAEQKAARAVGSIGAQVILDFAEDASLGARGGAAGTIEENTAVRDAHLISLGLVPHAVSGPPPGKPLEAAAPPPTPKAPDISPVPTRASSLAAGISGNGGGSKPAAAHH